MQVIVLPLEPGALPGGELHAWLAGCPGRRLLVPLPGEGFTWLGLPARSVADLARDAARAIRQVFDGELLRPSAGSPPLLAGTAILVLAALLILIQFLSSLSFD